MGIGRLCSWIRISSCPCRRRLLRWLLMLRPISSVVAWQRRSTASRLSGWSGRCLRHGTRCWSQRRLSRLPMHANAARCASAGDCDHLQECVAPSSSTARVLSIIDVESRIAMCVEWLLCIGLCHSTSTVRE